LHDDPEQARQHQQIVQIDITADVFDVVVDGDAERNFVKDAAFDFRAILDRFEDRIMASGDAIDFDHRVFPHAGDVIIMEFRKRPFVFTHVWQNATFENDLCIEGHLEVVGLALHDLGGFADQTAG
jgi:hypothetical protein